MAHDRRANPPTGTQFGVGPLTPTPASAASRGLGGAGVPIHSAGGRPIQTYAGASETALPGVDLQPGTLIAQYELIREIGHGGMGVVYAARDLKLGRRVAMKFLRTVDRDIIERFLIEARATAQCNHDNIVIIYEVAEYDGMPYMVLELLEGVSFRDLMCMFDDGEPMPPSRVVEVMLPVARALARAHELGIVHRDLKPENVLVTTNGQVKVLDFGIAKALGTADNHWRVPTQLTAAVADLALTNEGGIVGTLPYMSPEQMGVDQIDHRSDLFSVGMIMFEMLAGRHPVEPLTSDALVANLVTAGPMRSLRGAVPDLPEALIRIVDDCLRKPKVERIANATELARRLEALLPGRHGRQLADGESPYPGLTAFQETDADRFFGRSRDVTRMVARVRELPLTGIVGPSGVGKSSFIRAGVGPALKAGEPWDIVTLRPGRHPLAALASVVERFTPSGNTPAHPHDHQLLIERLRAEPGHLGALLRSRASASRSNLLLFVDQFEELYTLVPDLAERRAFTMALAAVADDSGAPLRVIVSMRSDFLDRVSEDARFMEELSRGLVFLSAPDRDGLREALEQPVEMVGFRFETAAMIDSMLDALATTPGALPLLQFAAAKLWDARDRGRRLLTAQSFAAIGGISGALATHADEVVRNMSAEAQRLTQRVFRQLVTPERTRAIVELADVYQLSTDRGEITRVIDLLVAARLLVVQMRADLGGGGGGSVELVHESLIDRWPMLARWLDEDQEVAAFVGQVSAAAKQWETKGRPAGLLWRGDAMEEARRWAAQRPRSLGAREQAFLDAVLALARRGRRARRIALVGGFVVLGAIAAGASVAYVRVSAAEQEATVALGRIQEQERRRSAAEQLRALAEADKQRAVDDKLKAVDDKLKAVDAKLKAEDEVKDKAMEVALTREELVQKNLELEGTVKETKLARERAEAASKQAVLSATEANRAKAELQVKLDAEKARVRALEEEKRKLSTQLKE